jgi:hypothetical protein
LEKTLHQKAPPEFFSTGAIATALEAGSVEDARSIAYFWAEWFVDEASQKRIDGFHDNVRRSKDVFRVANAMSNFLLALPSEKLGVI